MIPFVLGLKLYCKQNAARTQFFFHILWDNQLYITAFGFCEYEDPEATLRCIRLLNEWQITGKKLVVKVDAKTRTQLDEYKRKKKEKEKGPGQNKERQGQDDGEKEEGEADDETSTLDDPLDEFTMREDRVAKAGLDAIMREYAEDLNKEPPPGSE